MLTIVKLTVVNNHVDHVNTIVLFHFNDGRKTSNVNDYRVDHLKWILNDLNILEYKKGEEEYWNNHEIVSNLAENDEHEIRELNKRIDRLKIEEKNLEEEMKKSRKEKITKKEEEKEVTQRQI